ncbi:MAG: 2-amino-4-hydroxy-6-hydroxymethyldihydropteridine diphosphokinase [Deltaproteobacteria bacterium]|nr:2-amino-4-hydroxy-6-hydroxymethyldihydropteridine diphosphokinase [Deltaproteobacteria bacterium]
MLVYIGIGSNLGDKLGNCRRAIAAIVADRRNQLMKCSPFYQTEPVGKKDQDWFVNGVVAVETSQGPREFLDFLLAIERMMGRERGEPWGPRVIDLDLLFFGNEILKEGDLQIPHPRLHERRFVLVPLRDIAPHHGHPLIGKTISQILSELPEEEKVLPFPEAGQRPCFV